jgi:hypothetical protein
MPEPATETTAAPAAGESQETTEQQGAQGPSRPSSTASSAARSAFVEDPGPEHEPGNARPGAEVPPIGSEPPAIAWEEDSVRSILTAKGVAIHAVAGVADEDWIHTKDDLDSIAPPLTRILNRYPVTQAAAGTGDELAVVIGLSGYAMRSWTERKAFLEAVAEAEEEPVSGRPAEPIQPQAEEAKWTTDN